MAFTRREAKNLCTKTELVLVENSEGKALEAHSAAQLRTLVQRARTARDKYRDLERLQQLEAQGKPSPRRRQPRAEGSVRTERKAEIFGVVLERFESRVAQLEQGAAPVAKPVNKRARVAPRATDAPPGQSKTGHSRSLRRTVQQSLDTAPVDDAEAIEGLQLPKGTRSVQRRLARKPAKKAPASKKAAASKPAPASKKAAVSKKAPASKPAVAKKPSKPVAKKPSKPVAAPAKPAKKTAAKKTAAKKTAAKKTAAKKTAAKKTAAAKQVA